MKYLMSLLFMYLSVSLAIGIGVQIVFFAKLFAKWWG